MSVPSNLAELCAWMKAEGVVRLKVRDVEIDLGIKTAPHTLAEPPKPEAKSPEELRREYDALLFASSGG